MTLFSVKNKNVLVTGSTRGLGFIFARGLAAAGANVILNGVSEDRLSKAIQALKGEKFSVQGYAFDIREEDRVNDAIASMKKTIGSIDILVNNAGIQIRAPLEEFELRDWQKIIDVHLTGTFLVSKATIPHMIERNQGKIINICSIQSELARPTIAPYTAAKGGLRNLTRAMATDWGKYNIQVNGIAPGYFKTDMTRPLYEDKDFDKWLCSRTPANRWGQPEELLGALIFLASDASSYVNGHILYVDGGMLACV
jgi:gluconate 5-dehydrogenase